jgi:hypothetical protein
MKTIPQLADILCYNKQKTFIVLRVQENHWGIQWKTLKLMCLDDESITEYHWHEGVWDPAWKRLA